MDVEEEETMPPTPWGASEGQVWTRHLAPAAPTLQSLHCLISSTAVSGASARSWPLCCSLTSLNWVRGWWLALGSGL